MVKLTFRQTSAETVVRAASTVIFNALSRAGKPLVALSALTEEPQYGFTASAKTEPVGPTFVRITDLQDANIRWETVPYCECREPEKYLLQTGDVLFARTGATTGKTHLVKDPPRAVFASYLIRVRPKGGVLPDYLYSFFQSDAYWSQISEGKEGSAQPNVNGRKLMTIQIPVVEEKVQSAIASFLGAVRARQTGKEVELPPLAPPLDKQPPIVARIEQLAAKIQEARGLREDSQERSDGVLAGEELSIWSDQALKKARTLAEVTTFLARGRQSQQGPSDHHLIKTQHVQLGLYLPTQLTLAPSAAAKVNLESEVRRGDVLIACSAAGCLGRVAFYPATGVRASTDTHVAIARADPDVVLPEYLYAYLKGAQGQRQLRSREKGDWLREKIGFRLTELNVADMRRVPVPTPPLAEQRRIVTYLDSLRAKLDALQRLQAETATELDALLPSILDKAFKGEL